ncbi:hypothetical protein B0O99DRAFT_480203, partial [Bisporella sp. PMI_857]
SAPGRTAIQYQKPRLWRDLNNNPYTGDPRPEFDEAWSALIERTQYHRWKSIALAGGSGLMAEIATYHELYCVKRIRRSLHLDYYYPNMTADDLRKEKAHINRCLEYWRKAVMCRGDMSFATFDDHECVNWPRCDRWARFRMLDMSDLSILDQ